MRSALLQIEGVLIAAAGLVLLAGCVFPLPEHGGTGAAIPIETVNKLIPGTTSRAEVLLALGEPSQRISEDRAFVYRWSRIVGMWGAGIGAAGDIEMPRRLCLEFDSNGILTRKDLSQPGWLSLEAGGAPCGWRSNQPDGEKK